MQVVFRSELRLCSINALDGAQFGHLGGGEGSAPSRFAS